LSHEKTGKFPLDNNRLRKIKANLFETFSFGKCLVIDSETQSAEFDEYIYHESLTICALCAHPNPQTVLILGGGEGATAREILNCKNVKKLIMVDIDYHILNFAQAYMPSWHKGAFSNSNLHILVQDAYKYVKNSELKFDIIYSDLPSPIEGGPAYQMYTIEFYRLLKKRLNKNGIFVSQGGPGSLTQFTLHPLITNTLKKVFKSVKSYISFIPSYDMPWAFNFCSDSPKLDISVFDSRMIERRLSERFIKKPVFIDSETIKGIFNLPKIHRRIISETKKTISAKKPVFFTTSYSKGEKKWEKKGKNRQR